jgi:hypothetical protein
MWVRAPRPQAYQLGLAQMPRGLPGNLYAVEVERLGPKTAH